MHALISVRDHIFLPATVVNVRDGDVSTACRLYSETFASFLAGYQSQRAYEEVRSGHWIELESRACLCPSTAVGSLPLAQLWCLACRYQARQHSSEQGP